MFITFPSTTKSYGIPSYSGTILKSSGVCLLYTSTCDTKIFDFDTTQELENITTGIGQERGIKALEFGLQVDVKGYNLYIEGPSGVGKTMYTKNYLNKISKKQQTPNDWCYICLLYTSRCV